MKNVVIRDGAVVGVFSVFQVGMEGAARLSEDDPKIAAFEALASVASEQEAKIHTELRTMALERLSLRVENGNNR